MSMFDEVKYMGRVWQTKSLGCLMDTYEVDEAGNLHREDYDIEDRSDPNATGLRRLMGCMTKVNKRMIRDIEYIGELRLVDTGETVVLWVVNGQVRDRVDIPWESC